MNCSISSRARRKGGKADRVSLSRSVMKSSSTLPIQTSSFFPSPTPEDHSLSSIIIFFVVVVIIFVIYHTRDDPFELQTIGFFSLAGGGRGELS